MAFMVGDIVEVQDDVNHQWYPGIVHLVKGKMNTVSYSVHVGWFNPSHLVETMLVEENRLRKADLPIDFDGNNKVKMMKLNKQDTDLSIEMPTAEMKKNVIATDNYEQIDIDMSCDDFDNLSLSLVQLETLS